MIEIVTPATDARLASIGDLQATLEVTDYDAGRLLDQASEMISAYCRRVFPVQTYRETLRARSGLGVIMLRRYPVVSIASIVENGETLAAADYELFAPIGSILRLDADAETRWPAGKIVIQYQAGYAEIPAPVRAACLSLASSVSAAAERDPGLRSISVPDVISYSVFDAANGGGILPETVRTLIDPYREVSF